MEKIIKILKSWSGLAASLGAIIPGLSFFSNSAPVFFEYTGLLASGIGVIVFVLCALHETEIIRIRKRIFAFVGLAILLLVMYSISANFTTVKVDLEGSEKRYQIGFYLAQWSLTEGASDMIYKGKCGTFVPEEIISKCVTGKTPYIRIDKIWTKWSIVAAGLVNVLLFLAAFSFWVAGFVFLARYHDLKS